MHMIMGLAGVLHLAVVRHSLFLLGDRAHPLWRFDKNLHQLAGALISP
jgi:hypothetical protein